MENNTNDDEEPDSDLQEEQAALDCNQEMTGDALPSVVQIENLENHIYQCAPGENNIPKYILLDEDFEVLAFPDFFPYGEGGYYSEQSTKLPIQKYFQQHLLNVDICFAQNMEYLFCAQYISDIKQIQGDTNLAICLSCGRTLEGQKITAGMLQNPTALQHLVCNRTSIQVFEEHQRITCILATWTVWCTSNAMFFGYSNMVFDTICSRFTLAWNDSSSCTTAREKIVKGWCYEDEYRTKEHISMTKSHYWCMYVST